MSERRVISGTIEQVVFQQPASGFVVLRVKTQGRAEPVTVIVSVSLASKGVT